MRKQLFLMQVTSNFLRLTYPNSRGACFKKEEKGVAGHLAKGSRVGGKGRTGPKGITLF